MFKGITESPGYDDVNYWSQFPDGVNQLDGTGGSVAVQVLDTFDINHVVTAGSDLPGMDLKNVQASQAINISLGMEILNGRFVEVHANNLGVVEETVIGGPPGSLDVRHSISSVTLESPIDSVIITGYDPPISRRIGGEVDYLRNKQIYGVPDDVINNVCGGGLLLKTAYITFDDGVLNANYQDIIGDLGVFDNLTGFIFVIDNQASDTVSWSASNTTREFIVIGGAQLLNHFTDYFGGKGACWYTSGDVCYSPIRLGPFRHYDWEIKADVNDFESVARVFFLGREIISASAFGDETTLSVRHEKSIMEVPSDDWAADELAGGSPKICFKRVVHTNESALYALSKRTINTYSFYDQVGNFVSSSPSSAGEWIVDFAGKRMGWLVEKIWVEVIRNKPCIVVNDEAGNALLEASRINISAYPVITTDEPAPIASDAGLVNQESGYIDNDPVTVQSWEETSTFALNLLRRGNVIEITVPFLDDPSSLAVAIKKLYTESKNVSLNSFICGPNSSPNLGGSYLGGIINSIEYSYQDSGSYLITVTTGPKLERNIGLSQSLFILDTEDVQTSGIVTQCANNGVHYVVRTPRFGVLVAYSGVIEDFQVGDKVNVTIHNHPKVSFGGVY